MKYETIYKIKKFKKNLKFLIILLTISLTSIILAYSLSNIIIAIIGIILAIILAEVKTMSLQKEIKEMEIHDKDINNQKKDYEKWE